MNESGDNIEIDRPCRTSEELLLAIRQGKADGQLEKALSILKKENNKSFSSFEDIGEMKSVLQHSEDKEGLWSELVEIFFSEENPKVKAITRGVFVWVISILDKTDEYLKKQVEAERNKLLAHLESIKDKTDKLEDALINNLHDIDLFVFISKLLWVDKFFDFIKREDVIAKLGCEHIYKICEILKDKSDELFEWLNNAEVIKKLTASDIYKICEILKDYPNKLIIFLSNEEIITLLLCSNRTFDISPICIIFKDRPDLFFTWLDKGIKDSLYFSEIISIIQNINHNLENDNLFNFLNSQEIKSKIMLSGETDFLYYLNTIFNKKKLPFQAVNYFPIWFKIVKTIQQKN